MADMTSCQIPTWLAWIQAGAPAVAVLGGGLLAWAALKQARNSTRQAEAAAQQAETAARRHEEQTRADQQRRITESFAKATEQLGSDKIEMRLGGIYTLERISRESLADYWTVMEVLTAFVRERGRKGNKEESRFAQDTDVSAIMSVIVRRSEAGIEREDRENLRLDLSGADLRLTKLAKVRLEEANLDGVNLEAADLKEAHLCKSSLRKASLGGADFFLADLREVNLLCADLNQAHLLAADLKGARLGGAVLRLTNLSGTQLQGAEIHQGQINEALGNTLTKLPEGLTRPAHWSATPDTT